MKRHETRLTLWGDIWLRVNPLSLSSYSNLFEPTQLGHYRDLQTLSLLQISALTPLRLLMERRRRRQGRQGGTPPAPPVDFCERPLRPITKFERSVIDVIRYVR